MLKRVCCRCLEVLSTDHAEDAQVTHTFCLDCLPDLYPYDIESLRRMTPEMLDALPYGVVRLDAENRVIDYSRAEAELARLDRADVLGRDFFQDVAPCTNVQSLGGWVGAARNAGGEASKQMTFLFDFPHGRQLVKLTLVYEPRADTTVITVDVVDAKMRDPAVRADDEAEPSTGTPA